MIDFSFLLVSGFEECSPSGYIVNYEFILENFLRNSLFSSLGSLDFAQFRGHPVSSLEMADQEFVLGKFLPLGNKKKRGCD
jgi:hypothetical protein